MFGFEIIILLVLLLLFFGLPLVIKNMNFPVKISFEPARRDELEPDMASYFVEREIELVHSGFMRGPAFSIAEMENANYSEIFTDSRGNTATVGLISNADGTEHKGYLEFMTSYEQGPYLITKSSAGFDMFYDPPQMVTVSYYRVTNIEALLSRHQRLRLIMEEEGNTPRLISTGQVLEVQQDIQSRFLKYQEDRGILRYDEVSGRLKGTFRLGFSILSHFISLASFDIPWSSRLVSFATGMGCVILINSFHHHLSGLVESYPFLYALSLAAFFIAGGLATGLFFIRKVFPWSFLSAIIPSVYLAMTMTHSTVSVNATDLFLLYVSSGYLSSRLRTFRDMEGSYENLLYSGLAVFVLFFIFILGAR